MLAKLSSKGQLVIPKALREGLKLQPGSEFYIRLSEGKIILEPIEATTISMLYGKYAGDNFLTEHEAKHRQEVVDDETVRS
ncbi:MAG: AbrB/MazE/SpoVT family DNA-binding domain-containing protein [Chloroflexota bacterium]